MGNQYLSDAAIYAESLANGYFEILGNDHERNRDILPSQQICTVKTCFFTKNRLY